MSCSRESPSLMPRAFGRPPDIAETWPVLSRRIPVASSATRSCWGTLLTEWTYLFCPRANIRDSPLASRGWSPRIAEGRERHPTRWTPRRDSCLGKAGSTCSSTNDWPPAPTSPSPSSHAASAASATAPATPRQPSAAGWSLNRAARAICLRPSTSGGNQ
jgi:hypothetical protein